MKEKVVLAYSGGLDTTAIIPWLKENFDLFMQNMQKIMHKNAKLKCDSELLANLKSCTCLFRRP